MKPWSHLVERIRTRTGELHDLIHYPTPHSSSAAHSDLLKLERKLKKMEKKVGGVVDEVYEYVDEAVDGVQHSLKKQERRSEKWEGKVREVEVEVGGIHAKLSKSPERGFQASLSLDGAYAYSLLAYVLPQWLLDLDAPHHRGLYGPSLYSPTSTIASRHHHHYQHSSFPSSPSTPLETIVEEDDSTAVNGKRQEKYQYPFLARPMWITSCIIMRVGYLMMVPLRAVIRMVLRRY